MVCFARNDNKGYGKSGAPTKKGPLEAAPDFCSLNLLCRTQNQVRQICGSHLFGRVVPLALLQLQVMVAWPTV